MKNNKKGFTLIELLAVIVILAVIALIATPLIMNVIKEARKHSFEETVRRVFDAYELYKANNDFSEEELRVEVTSSLLPIKSNLKSGLVYTDNNKNATVKNVTDSAFCANGVKDSFIVVEGDCSKLDDTPAIIKANLGAVTSSTVKISVEADDKESGIKGYLFSIDDGVTYTSMQKNNSYTFTNLNQNTEYKIKVKVINGNDLETISPTIVAKTIVLSAPTYEIDKEGWQKEKNVTITYVDNELLKYSYSLDKGSTWNDAARVQVVKFKSNGTLIARISDGVNTINSNVITIDQIDNNGPNIASIVPNTTSYTTNLTLTINASDNEVGLHTQPYSFDNGSSWTNANNKAYTTGGTINIQVRDILGNISTKQIVINSQTEYGYQDVSSWSSVYDTIEPIEGYYNIKPQYRFIQKVAVATTRDEGFCRLNGSTDVNYSCSNYCISYNGGYLYGAGTCDGKSSVYCQGCTRYRGDTACGSTYGSWQDSSSGTGCSSETRNTYAQPELWGASTGWTTSGPYSKTNSRKPVTRTTIQTLGI